MWCKACGGKLGPPSEVLHDPDGLSGIVEGGVENPDDHHLRATDGEKGPRLQCMREKQFTKILQDPPGEGSGDSPPKDTGGQRKSSAPKDTGPVYEITGDENPLDILEEVVTAPAFDINEGQVEELLSWGDIYDGQIPPQQVENVLANFSGVSKQKAKLIRHKYEAKLNKWMQENANNGGSPSLPQHAPIGQRPQPQPSGSGGPNRPQQGTRPPGGAQRSVSEFDDESSDLRSRRQKRVERRQEAFDNAVEEFAQQAASNAAQDAGMLIAESREIFTTLIKQKAKKDPDWFFEKAEKWDMDLLDTIMESSEAKKQEKKQASGVDSEVDAALERAMGDPDPVHDDGVDVPEEVFEEGTQQADEHPQEPGTKTPEDEAFEETFEEEEVEEVPESEEEGEEHQMFEEVFGGAQ